MKKKTLALCICILLMVTTVTARELFGGSMFHNKDTIFSTSSVESGRQFLIISTTELANQSPIFGTPSPVNNSMNNPLSFIWSIQITDPEGDRFNWTIECNNGQTNSSIVEENNGIKSLDLSGLAYIKTYTVWVNATDTNGSGLYTREWYHFTTKESLPPVFGMPTPLNNSMLQPLSFTWSIPIHDPEGDVFSWTIECSNGQSNSSSGDSNGTKELALFGLVYLTSYMVWVNASDLTGNVLYSREWFVFTTQLNLPPVFGTPSPTNGSTGNALSLAWSIPINDPEGDSFDWNIDCSNKQSADATGEGNGTKTVSLSGLTYSTPYTVWVNATDPFGSGQYTKEWYTFTTRDLNTPPVFGTPTPPNGSINQPLNFTWSILISDPESDAFSWTIQCNNSQASSGSGASNGSKTLALSGLTNSTTYKVWVNATDLTGSGQYRREWYIFTTKANHPPVFGAPTPSNGSTGNPLNLIWSIPINDSEGDAFSWSIQCSSGLGSIGTKVGNGTKSLILYDLTYATTYKIWVNATDLTGSGQYTREWYSFITKANTHPIFGAPTPANRSTGNPLSLTWTIPINDLEGDNFNWTIECSNGQNTSATSQSNGTKSLPLSNLSYSKTYRVWVNATDSTGSGLYTKKWYSFTVRDLGGGGGGGPPAPPAPSNKDPIADASAGAPYQGVVNSPILFDGSYSYDPDGTITKWLWVFGDNTNTTGRLVNHTYSKAGTYLVILKVTDNEGATNTIVTTCIVKQENRPPTQPTITGPISGTKNTLYTYTAASTDLDNDPLNYTFDWGDTTMHFSGFFTNATSYSTNHSWTTAGRYHLNVTVTDNHSKSYSKIVVYIDAVQARGAGYLLDNDSDGIYDAFYSDETYQIIALQKEDDNYLIDKDKDGDWDYVYNATHGLTLYQESQGLPGFEIISAIGAVIFILFWKRKNLNKNS